MQGTVFSMRTTGDRIVCSSRFARHLFWAWSQQHTEGERTASFSSDAFAVQGGDTEM